MPDARFSPSKSPIQRQTHLTRSKVASQLIKPFIAQIARRAASDSDVFALASSLPVTISVMSNVQISINCDWVFILLCRACIQSCKHVARIDKSSRHMTVLHNLTTSDSLTLSVSIRRQQTSEFFQLYTLDRLNAEKCLINEPGEQLPVLVRVTDVPLRRESDPFIFHFVFNCYTSCLNTLGDAKNTLKGTTGTKLIILIVIICLYSAECGKNNLQSFARQ